MCAHLKRLTDAEIGRRGSRLSGHLLSSRPNLAAILSMGSRGTP